MKFASHHILVTAVIVYLVNKAQTELITQWIWTKGCRNQPPEDVTPDKIASAPGPCFHLCGNGTRYIALQGNKCRCLGELRLAPGSIETGCSNCDGDQDLHCGHKAENLWSYYERGSQLAALDGQVDNRSASICVAVQYRQGGLIPTVVPCSETLHVICSDFLSACKVFYDKKMPWRDAGEWCAENFMSQVELLNKCKGNRQDFVNNENYWIGLRRISYSVNLTTESSSYALSPTPTFSSSSLPTSILSESPSSISLTSSSLLISTSSLSSSPSLFSPSTSSLLSSSSALSQVSQSSLILLSPSSSDSSSLTSISPSLSSSSPSSTTASPPSSIITLLPTPSSQATTSRVSSLPSSLISPTMKLFASVSTTSLSQIISSYTSSSNSSSSTTTRRSPTTENIQLKTNVKTTTEFPLNSSSAKAITDMTSSADRTPAINITTTSLRLPPTENPAVTNTALNKTQPPYSTVSTTNHGSGIGTPAISSTTPEAAKVDRTPTPTENAAVTNTALNKTQPSYGIVPTTNNAFGTRERISTTTPEAAITTSPKKSQASDLATTPLGRSQPSQEIAELFTTTQTVLEHLTTPIRRETTTNILDNPLAMHQMMTADKELKTYYAAFGASTIALLVLIAMFLCLINRSIRKLSYSYLYTRKRHRKPYYGVEGTQGNGLLDGAMHAGYTRRMRRPVTSGENVRHTTGVNNNGYTWDTHSNGDGYHDDDDLDVNAIYREEQSIGFRSATRFNGRNVSSALHTGYTSSGRIPSDHL